MNRDAGAQDITVRVPGAINAALMHDAQEGERSRGPGYPTAAAPGSALMHDAQEGERSLDGQIVLVLRRWYEGQRAVPLSDEDLEALRREADALPDEGGTLPTLDRLANARDR